MPVQTKHTSMFLLATVLGASAVQAAPKSQDTLPREKLKVTPQLVATFRGPMPTGVTVSHRGRIFTNFPRWGDPVQFTVAEVRNGRAVPFPNMAWNRRDKSPLNRFVSVQSVVVDARDRLWALDTGSVKFGAIVAGGPKLVGIDLKTNRVVRKIVFPSDVALEWTYLNDVRFDLRRGRGGMAFITDSSGPGPNAIIVVDLASGRSWRKLHNHPSTKAVPKFVPIVEGMALMQRPPGQMPKYVGIGADGIAISADGERLYYCPLASRRLYSVSVDALADENRTASQVAATVVDHGDKGASDGLESDDKGRVYCTEYEHNAILMRHPNGLYQTLVHDPKVLWPDTLSVARDGYLYFTANQLHRQPNFHSGKDLRVKPYSIMRIKIDAGPVLLK